MVDITIALLIGLHSKYIGYTNLFYVYYYIHKNDWENASKRYDLIPENRSHFDQNFRFYFFQNQPRYNTTPDDRPK